MRDHGSPMRKLVDQSRGVPYSSLASLDQARETPDAYVILEGDDGGQIYLTCPARLVTGTEDELTALLEALDEEAWPGNDSEMRRVCYEVVVVSGVAGGMGGGETLDGLWLHPTFERTGWRPRAEGILFKRH